MICPRVFADEFKVGGVLCQEAGCGLAGPSTCLIVA